MGYCTKALVFATFVFASIASDINPVYSDLKQVTADCNSCTSAANSYSGGSDIAPVTNAINKLDSDIEQTCKDLAASGTITPAQCSQIENYIQATVVPSVKQCLNALVAKKSAFTAAGAKAIVVSDINELKKDSDTCLTNLAKDCGSASVKPLQSTIDSIFNSASLAYA